MPNSSFVWLPLTCREGLVYNKNIQSCIIPDSEWDCRRSNDETAKPEESQENVYEVENLEDEKVPQIFDENFMEKSGDDEFIEVIDGQDDFRSTPSRQNARLIEFGSGDEKDDINYSGDGFTLDFTTQSSIAITTHLQRLTQLMEKVWETSESESKSTQNPEAELTPADLNRFLTEKTIQTESTKKFNDETKTPMPANGKIHPSILSEVLTKQQKIHKDAIQIATIPMDQTTPTVSQNNILFADPESMTDVELKTGFNPNHQIVVNRPEGSVVFNVPVEKTKENQPILSQDILKTVLELSKQLASQRYPTKEVYLPNNYMQPQPIYYPYPMPVNPGFNAPQNSTNYKTKIDMNGSWQGPYGNVKLPGLHNENRKKKPFKQAMKKPEVSYEPYEGTKSIFPSLHYYPNFHHYYNPLDHPQTYEHSYGPHESFPGPAIQNRLKNKMKINDRQDYYGNRRPNPSSNIKRFPNPHRYPETAMDDYPYESNSNHKNVHNDETTDYDSEDGENGPVVIESSAHYVEHSNKRHKIRNNNKPLLKESIQYNKKKNDYGDVWVEDDGVEGDAAEDISDDDNQDKLVNLGGHLYHYENFKEHVWPLLKSEDKVDLLECSVGTRQPNATDCKKYYVCNPRTKHVSSYTCPPFTAFNSNTRLCDAKSFTNCKSKEENKYSVDQNRLIHLETLKALAQAKAEAAKAQKIASMLRKQQKIGNRSPVFEDEESNEDTSNYDEYTDSREEPVKHRTTTTTTVKPPSKRKSSKPKKKKRKLSKCTEPG